MLRKIYDAIFAISANYNHPYRESIMILDRLYVVADDMDSNDMLGWQSVESRIWYWAYDGIIRRSIYDK